MPFERMIGTALGARLAKDEDVRLPQWSDAGTIRLGTKKRGRRWGEVTVRGLSRGMGDGDWGRAGQWAKSPIARLGASRRLNRSGSLGSHINPCSLCARRFHL